MPTYDFVKLLLLLPLIVHCLAQPGPPVAVSSKPGPSSAKIELGDAFMIHANIILNLDEAKLTEANTIDTKRAFKSHPAVVIRGPDSAGIYDLTFASNSLPGRQPKMASQKILPGSGWTGEINLWRPIKINKEELLKQNREPGLNVRGANLQNLLKEVAANEHKPRVPDGNTDKIEIGDVFMVEGRTILNMDEAKLKSSTPGWKARKLFSRRSCIVVSGPDANRIYELEIIQDTLTSAQPKALVRDVMPNSKMTGEIDLWVPIKVKEEDLFKVERKPEWNARDKDLSNLLKQVAANRGKPRVEEPGSAGSSKPAQGNTSGGGQNKKDGGGGQGKKDAGGSQGKKTAGASGGQGKGKGKGKATS